MVRLEVYMPHPPAPSPTPEGFVLFPLAFLGNMPLELQAAVLSLYEQALEEARAVARPSLPERDLPGVWN